jgi:O-antigen ligase
MRMSGGRLDKAIVVGLLATAVFTALAHGAVEFWAVSIFELIVACLVLLWGVRLFVGDAVLIKMPRTSLPLLALLALGIVQSIATQDATGRKLSLSMDVEATRSAVAVVVALIAFFAIAANFVARRDRLPGVATFLIVYGLALALFALVQHITWNGRLYWVRPITSGAVSPFGPFVNRNHFAGYMEMLIPIPIALLMTGGAKRDSRLFYVFAATMMAVAAVASLSRGGIISLVAELIFLASLGAKRRARLTGGGPFFLSHPVALTALVVAAISAGVFWIGAEPVVNRIINSTGISGEGNQTFFASRGWIWRDTLAMIEANPITGVGLGAYETAYPIYSEDDGTVTLGQSLVVDRAHNDYLQVLADCGIVGFAIAVWFIVTIFRATWRGSKSRDSLSAGFALGCGAGIFGLLVHSLFDFNLQLPSNALLFLLLAAVASHTAETGRRSERNRTEVFEIVDEVEAVALTTGEFH